jgi:site-specific DNA recombinase
MTTLRFAPLIRVSTEQQEKKESLRTQTEQIKQYVKSLDGTIPDNCWVYSGQEHATPDQERKKLDKLLADSGKNKFDAVIVCDASRWSRDNLKSKEGLNVLRNNGIRFFVGTMEYDLFNPEHCFILGMSAEIGEFQARIQSLKSITNRINRARRNIPASGKLPYGRTYDPDKGWGLDEKKVQIIQRAAEQYLNGMTITQIADLAGMSFTNLWRVLNERSGSTWTCRFQSKELNIDETITMMIPPLLDEETIARIKEKGAANKTYTHGQITHPYLFSRMIFCAKCGRALFGQANSNNRGKDYYTYYRHPRRSKEDCDWEKWVPEAQIGPAVLKLLFEMFGDTDRIEQAMQKAIPDLDKIEAMRAELDDLNKSRKTTLEQRERLISLAAEGVVEKDEVAKRITEIRERLRSIENQIEVLEPQLENLPDPAQIKRRSKLARAVLVDALKHPSVKALDKFLNAPFERQRKIIENAFAGKDREGRRLGVYVEPTDDPERPWRFEIRAVLDQVVEFFYSKDLEETEDIKASFSWYSLNKTTYGSYVRLDGEV